MRCGSLEGEPPMPARTLHIALVTDGITPFVIGGIQRHSRMLAETLAGLGVRVTLFHTAAAGDQATAARSLAGFPDALRPWISSQFLEPERRFWFPGHYRFDCAHYSRRALARFRETCADVDFVYTQGLTGLAFVAARRAGAPLPPVGVNAHGYEAFQKCFGLKSRIDQWLIRGPHRRISLRADVVFSFSGKIREIVEKRIGVPADRVVEIPNGVDRAWVSQEIRPAIGMTRFLFVGRHERRKGLPELFAAIGRLPPEGWSLDVVGPIPESHQIRHPLVQFLGPISDPAALLRKYDESHFLVCPSFAEGMPTVILEAMARGVPSIATDVGAISELVSRGTGILLPAPSPEFIGSAMLEAIHMTDHQRDRMRHSAWERSSGYCWDVLGTRIVGEITRVIERK
jgi:glycosyltransferase involved in cell wall biosynthesis